MSPSLSSYLDSVRPKTHWTRDKPKVNGYYWQSAIGDRKHAVMVLIDRGRFFVLAQTTVGTSTPSVCRSITAPCHHRSELHGLASLGSTSPEGAIRRLRESEGAAPRSRHSDNGFLLTMRRMPKPPSILLHDIFLPSPQTNSEAHQSNT